MHFRTLLRSVPVGTLVLTVLMMLPGSVFAQTTSSASKDGGNEPHIQFLVRRATDGKVPERALAMRKLGRIGFSTIIPVLEKGLSAPDQRLRVAAVNALGQIDLPAASDLLGEALRAEDELVSTAAAALLQKRSAVDGIPMLIDGLTHSSRTIRTRCRNTLRQWTATRFDFRPDAPSDQRRKAVKRWRTWWKQHRELSPEEWWLERVRHVKQEDTDMAPLIDAIRQLTDRRSWSALPGLIRLLGHDHSPVRVEALNAIRTISSYRFDRSSDDPEAVAESVQDRWRDWWEANGENGRVNWLVDRLKAVIDRHEQEGGEVGKSERTVIVHELISSGQQDVPASVASMLLGSRMDREVGIRILRGRTGLSFGYREDLDEGNRNRAVRRWRTWLDRRSNREKLDWMVHALERNRWTESRVAAAEYLGTVRKDASVRALIRHGLNDQKEAVREASLTALRRLTGRQFDFRADGSWERRKAWRRQWQEWWRRQDQFFAKRGY